MFLKGGEKQAVVTCATKNGESTTGVLGQYVFGTSVG
jgi:hypothetical protein